MKVYLSTMGGIIGKNPPNDWSIASLYEKAFAVVKNNKVLWIFGMAAASLGAGGCNYNFSQLGNIFSEQQKEPLQDVIQTPPASYDQISQVLGASTNQVFDIIGQLFSAIPVYFWMILAVEILAIMVLAIVVGLINKAWSGASLIHGVQSAIDNDQPTIRDSSQKAFANLKSLIWLNVVPNLVLVAISIVVLVPLGVAISLVPSLRIPLMLLVVIGFIGLLLALLFLSLSQIWSLRLVILENRPAKASLFSGFRIARKKLWPMLLLVVVNTILTGIVMGILFAPIIVLVIGGVIAFGANSAITGILIALGAVLFLVFILGWTFISGLLTAFKASIWTLAYNTIRGKYDGN